MKVRKVLMLCYFVAGIIVEIVKPIFAEEIWANCKDEARDHLEKLCMKLPEKNCIERPMNNRTRCGEYEFDCGNGQCIPGLGVCDRKYQCMNGADELVW